MKIWAFTEGYSEEHFILKAVRRYFPHIFIQANEDLFVEAPDLSGQYLLHITNCRSIDRIAHDIEKLEWRLKKSCSQTILIVGDVEKELKCPSIRVQKIQSIIMTNFEPIEFKYVLSCPVIESIYWEHPKHIYEVTKKLLEVRYPTTHKSIKIDKEPLLEKKDYKGSLKRYLIKYKLSYRESNFAESFFGKLDYEFSANNTVQRLMSFLSFR